MAKQLTAGVSITNNGEPISSNIVVDIADSGTQEITLTGSDGTNISVVSSPSHSSSGYDTEETS